MKKIISICIPLYNGRSSIERCLLSIFENTAYDPDKVEIIVVDDASSDDSLQLLESYLLDGRIRLIQNEARLGLTANWNKALTSGTGEVVTLLHQDDWYDKEALSTLFDLFGNGSDIAFAAFGQIYHPGDGAPPGDGPRLDICTCTGSEYFLRRMTFKDIPAPSTAFFPRKYLSDQSTIFNGDFRFCSEYDLYLRLALAHPEATFIHDPRLLIHRGLGHNRFSVRFPGFRILDFCRIMEKYVPLIYDQTMQQNSMAAARERISRDFESLLSLSDGAQLKTTINDPGFQKWMRSDLLNLNAVKMAIAENERKIQTAFDSCCR